MNMATTVSQSKPVMLYEFSRGSQLWTYASSDRDIQLYDRTYQAVAISDNGVSVSNDPTQDQFEVTAPANLAPALLYRAAPPSDAVWLTVRELQWGDVNAPVIWIGTVATVKRPALESVTFQCRSLVDSFERTGISLTWGRDCPYTLYDHQCRADPARFCIATTVAAADGATVTAANTQGHPDGWFAGGWLEWNVADDVVDRRGISSSTGAVLTIYGSTDGLEMGQLIRLYPGCAHVPSVCTEKFNNHDNYGGAWHLPGKSPFDGTPVFWN